MMNKAHKEDYYENTDFSELIEQGKGKLHGKIKRITINISDTIYEEANELDSYMQMGYQNVLKTAMSIGITELYHQIQSHTIGQAKKTRSPSWRSRKKPVQSKKTAPRRARTDRVR